MPGVDAVYMVYDKRDRLVLSQDGNQRNTNSWMYCKYDTFNRVIETGLCGSSASMKDLSDEIGLSVSYVPSSIKKY